MPVQSWNRRKVPLAATITCSSGWDPESLCGAFARGNAWSTRTNPSVMNCSTCTQPAGRQHFTWLRPALPGA